MKINKTITVCAALGLAVLAAGQVTPPISPVDPMKLPDSAFDSVQYVCGGSNKVITGDFHGQAVRIRVSDVRGLKIQNLELGPNSEVLIAGCSGHSVKNVKIGENSVWQSWPVAVRKENMRLELAWWSATNGAMAIGDRNGYRHDFQQEWWDNNTQITVDADQLKRGSSPADYVTLPLKVRDSSGAVFTAKIVGWTPSADGRTVAMNVKPNGVMAKGPGFWQIYDPAKFQKGLVYDGFEASNHRTVSFYFADGVVLKNGKLFGARVDYNIGFEWCANVAITNTWSAGNLTVGGNGADVAFLFGVRGLKASGNTIHTLAITSAGCEVSGVSVDQQVSWLDLRTGWLSSITQMGKPLFDKAGQYVGK